MDELEHSILSCSAAGIWGAEDGCPGYVTAAQLFPDLDDDDDAEEGTAAHYFGEQYINQETLSYGESTPHDYVGAVSINGVVCDEQMSECAYMYGMDVVSVVKDPQVNEYGVERRVLASEIHQMCWGTCDAWAFNRALCTLYVWDFKYGFRWVSEYKNWQMMCYVAGLLSMLGLTGSTLDLITVHMRVVQPRAHGKGGPVREWVVKASDLLVHFSTLAKNALDALSPSPTYRSGEHCRYCPARGGKCKTLMQSAFNHYEAATTAMPQEVTPHSVGVLLETVERALERLGAIHAGLDVQAKHYMRNGQQVPHRTLENTVSRLQWDRDTPEVKKLGELLNVDLMAPEKPITPKQAIDKYKIDSSIINEYCTRRQTGVKVVRTDHNDVERIFRR
jgi:hypothetical protein